MRLTLTDEQQMIQTMAREFAESEIKPVAEELDREEPSLTRRSSASASWG